MNKLSKTLLIIVSVIVAAVYVGAATHSHKSHKGHEHDEHDSEKVVQQTQCPIMKKNKIDKSLYYEHEGKKIYVCCKGCIKKVAKNADKLVKHYASAGITLDKAQTTCPVSGKELTSKKSFVDHDGQRTYFCCAGCVKSFKNNPEKYIKVLHDAGIAIDVTPEKKHEGKSGHGAHEGHDHGDHN